MAKGASGTATEAKEKQPPKTGVETSVSDIHGADRFLRRAGHSNRSFGLRCVNVLLDSTCFSSILTTILPGCSVVSDDATLLNL